MTPVYLQILQELEKYGIGIYVNLSSLLNNLFHVDDTHDSSKIEFAREKFNPVSNILTQNNYIQLKPISQPQLGSGNTTNGFIWFDTYNYEATITPFGMTHLSDLKNKELIEKVNQSVVDTNKATKDFIPIQKRIAIASVIISAIALAFSIIAVFRDNEKEVKNLNNTLELRLQKLDTTLQNLKSHSVDSSTMNQ